MSFKYGTIYRQVITSPSLEWCQFMKTDMSHKLHAQLIKLLRAADPNLVRPCPYNEYQTKNFTFNSKVMLSVFPTGDYKMIFWLTGKFNESLANVTVIASFKSSNRDTFG